VKRLTPLSLISGSVLLVALLAAWVVHWKTSSTDLLPPPGERVINVEVQDISPLPELIDFARFPAVLEAERVVTVSAEVAGRVEKICCAKGHACQAGDILLLLNTDLLKAADDRAQAQLVISTSNLRRARQLLKQDLEIEQLKSEIVRSQARAKLAAASCRRIDKLESQGAASKDALEAAESARDQAQATLKSARLALSKANIYRQDGVERAEALYKQAEAALRSARAQLERATIKAPVSGILDELIPEKGEYLHPGIPVARIVSTSRVKARVMVPEKDSEYIKTGQVASITILIGGQKTALTGKVTYISEIADKRTHSTRVEISIENPEGRLQVGRLATVKLTRRTFKNMILVPLDSVIPLEKSRRVYVVEDGSIQEPLSAQEISKLSAEARKNSGNLFRRKKSPVAAQREVVIDGSVIESIAGRAYIRILSGLKPGDRLITSGQKLVASGQPVEVRAIHKSPSPPQR
jgi:multidrug efflux pump subunit AcrA (membrane-fusion protein)